jgi:hypothetical protein
MADSKSFQFESVTKLGALKSVHKFWINDVSESVKVYTVFLLIGIPFALILIPLLGIQFSLGIILFFMLISGIMPLFNLRFTKFPSVALYENGFVYYDPKNVKEIAWSDIETIWGQQRYPFPKYRGYLNFPNAYIIYTTDGSIIKLGSGFARFDALAKNIFQKSSPIIFSRYWQKIQSGQRVSFDVFEVDRNALYFGASLPTVWQNVRHASSNSINIYVQLKDRSYPLAVRFSSIPNPLVFCELVNKLSGNNP